MINSLKFQREISEKFHLLKKKIIQTSIHFMSMTLDYIYIYIYMVGLNHQQCKTIFMSAFGFRLLHSLHDSRLYIYVYIYGRIKSSTVQNNIH